MTTTLDRPALRPAALLALCGALLLALPAPAQAHDSLVSTDPEDGATLETSPEELTFTFSGELLDVSPLVRITDESGEELAEVTPTIDGPTATAELPEPMPAGTHTVQWRVVSGDGHPIEGTLTLTVEQGAQSAAPSDGGGTAAEGEATSEPAAQDSEEPAETTETTGDQPTAEEDSDSAAGQTGLGVGTLVLVLAVVVLGAGGAALAILRRRD